MATRRAQGVLPLSPNYKVATKHCLSTKGIRNALPNHPFYILVFNSLRRPLQSDRIPVLERLTDDANELVTFNRFLKMNCGQRASLMFWMPESHQRKGCYPETEWLAGSNIHSQRIQKFSWRIYSDPWTICRHVGWTFRSCVHCKTGWRFTVVRCRPYTLSTVPYRN